MGLLERANVPGVVYVRLGDEARLHPVNLRVEYTVLETEAHKYAGDDLSDRRPRALLERDIYGRTGGKRQAARLDEACAVIFHLDLWLVCTVLEVPRETGGQAGEVTLKLQPRGSHEGGIRGEMDLLESHDCGDPVGQDLPLDGGEIAGPVLVGSLPN